MRAALTFSHDRNSWLAYSQRMLRWYAVSPEFARALFDGGDYPILDV